MLKVLGRQTSINARKVLWALDELGEPYEQQDWGLPLRDPHVPEFLALNPNGMVPVLIEADGTALWESNAILVYLAQTRGRLLPEDRAGLGRALQWLGWQATDLNFAWKGVQGLIRNGADAADPALHEAKALWRAKMEILEGELGKGEEFIAPGGFSIADIALGLSCHRWFKAPLERPHLPFVDAYYARLLEREAGARWMSESFT